MYRFIYIIDVAYISLAAHGSIMDKNGVTVVEGKFDPFNTDDLEGYVYFMFLPFLAVGVLALCSGNILVFILMIFWFMGMIAVFAGHRDFVIKEAIQQLRGDS